MKTKIELNDNLGRAISQYNDNAEITNKMLKVYAEKKLPLRTVGNIFKEYTQIEDLYEIEKGIWCYYLFEFTGDKIINPIDYFGEGEIEQIVEYTNRDQLETKMDDIILEDVKEIFVNGKVQYVCPFVSYYMLYRIMDNRLLRYNFETQRNAKMEKYKDRIVRKANINKTAVKEISELILEGRFQANLLSWNVKPTKNLTKGFSYDRNTRILKITPNASENLFIDDVDGRHRFEGAIKAVETANLENRTLEGGFIVTVLNLNVDQAQDFISIQNRHNPIDKEHIDSFEKNDYSTFTKMLNTKGGKSENKMYDMICNTIEEAKLKNKFTSINIMNEGLKIGNTKLDDPYIRDNKVDDFIEVFNTIIGHYQYQYQNDDKKIRKLTVLLQPNSFIGYIAIANELIDLPDYKTILRNLLKTGQIDLTKESYDWESLDLYKKNPKSYKKIYDYFRMMVQTNLSEVI